MPATPHPTDLSAALTLLHDQLPGLMGKPSWDTLPASLRAAADRLGRAEDEKEQQSAAAEVRQELAGHPKAHDEVSAWAAELSSLRQRLLPLIRQTLGNEKEADRYARGLLQGVAHEVAAAAPADEPGGAVRTRGIGMRPRGDGGAVTAKLRNLLVHPGKAAEVVAHSALFAVGGSSHANPLLLGLGVVLLANCVREAITIHIPEHDATVLWGLIQAQKRPGGADSAPEPDVVDVTNSERTGAKRGALSPADIVRSLNYLADIKCVEKVAGAPARWRVIEKFKIRG